VPYATSPQTAKDRLNAAYDEVIAELSNPKPPATDPFSRILDPKGQPVRLDAFMDIPKPRSPTDVPMTLPAAHKMTQELGDLAGYYKTDATSTGMGVQKSLTSKSAQRIAEDARNILNEKLNQFLPPDVVYSRKNYHELKKAEAVVGKLLDREKTAFTNLRNSLDSPDTTVMEAFKQLDTLTKTKFEKEVALRAALFRDFIEPSWHPLSRGGATSTSRTQASAKVGGAIGTVLGGGLGLLKGSSAGSPVGGGLLGASTLGAAGAGIGALSASPKGIKWSIDTASPWLGKQLSTVGKVSRPVSPAIPRQTVKSVWDMIEEQQTKGDIYGRNR
jgi:hypothetical protein